jgi:putative ABC transport system permease protein
MSLLRETTSSIKVNLLGIPRRLSMSFATVLSVALVVLVLLGFLAMASGFRAAMARAGSEDVAVILSRGTDSEFQSSIAPEEYRLVASAPGIMSRDGHPLISGEVLAAVGAIALDGEVAGLTLRGIEPQGPALRDGFMLSAGRMFRPGSREIVVGRGVVDTFPQFRLGDDIRLGPSEWIVVGTFEAGGSAYESEVWADTRTVQSLFALGPDFRAIRARVGGGGLATLKAFAEADPRVRLSVRSERAYFESQSAGMARFIGRLGWPLGFTMALGALAGALNTMYTSVAMRGAEIATLRTIGFGGFATFAGTMAESLLLALTGGVIGVGAAYLIFQNLATSTLNGQFTQTMFHFHVSPWIAAQALMLSAFVGVAGGILPAWRSARQPIHAGLQQG